jgi:hypothetical protein
MQLTDILPLEDWMKLEEEISERFGITEEVIVYLRNLIFPLYTKNLAG